MVVRSGILQNSQFTKGFCESSIASIVISCSYIFKDFEGSQVLLKRSSLRSLHQFLDYVTYAVFKKRNMPLKCLFGCMYKEQVFQGSKGQSSTRLLEVDFIMCRSLKLVLVFFLVMTMIEHSSSWLMIYRKLKPVEPLSGPLDHENKVRIKISVLIFMFSVFYF